MPPRTRSVVPAQKPRLKIATPDAPQIDLTEQMKWVRDIARNVLKRHRLTGPSELDDICQSGLVELCRKLPDFNMRMQGQPDGDPVGAFRGYTYKFIKKACERECERLMNAGTYRSRRQVKGAPLVIGVPRSECMTPSGDQIEETSVRDTSRSPYEFLRAA